ncbi:MAG TPA: hypothetical protein VHV75_07055 [Solirubrobacteraceae bacterium]|nr:hypothetical protein [Solirubrobacteraceae bacterium]
MAVTVLGYCPGVEVLSVPLPPVAPSEPMHELLTAHPAMRRWWRDREVVHAAGTCS